MNRPRFSCCLPTFAFPGAALYRTPGYAAVDPTDLLPLGREIEALGFDGIFVPDHLMTGRDDAVLEGWTVLAALAAATERVRLGLIKQSIFFRPPGLTAKMAATLDQLSGGRLTFFCGTGAFENEHTALGLDWPRDPAVQVEHLGQQLRLLRALWQGREPVTERFGPYAVDAAVCAPQPVQEPLPLWLSGIDPASLELTAAMAQGWNVPPVTLDEFRRRHGLLAAAMAGANRPLVDIEVSLEIQLLVAEDRAALRDMLKRLVALDPEARTGGGPALLAADDPFLTGATDELPAALADTWLVGTPDEVAGRIAAFAAAGVDHFLLWFVDLPDRGGLQRFGETVLRRFASGSIM